MGSQELSFDLWQLLNGKNLEEKQHYAMILSTVTEEMWPHSAMISVGEVVALSPTELRIALWPNTTTTNNILRSGRAMIIFIVEGKVNYISLSLRKLEELDNPKHVLVRFAAEVVSFREDVAKYADITSGIEIRLENPDDVMKRWYETIEDLLK